MKFGVVIIAFTIAVVCVPVLAVGQPDALNYSYKIWKRGQIPHGQTKVASTPFGKLTCFGGNGYNSMGESTGPSAPRRCHW